MDTILADGVWAYRTVVGPGRIMIWLPAGVFFPIVVVFLMSAIDAEVLQSFCTYPSTVGTIRAINALMWISDSPDNTLTGWKTLTDDSTIP